MSNAVRTRLFVSDGEQTVRIPDELAFADAAAEVTVSRRGDVLTIEPVRLSLREVAERLRELPKPAEVERREPIELPERPGN